MSWRVCRGCGWEGWVEGVVLSPFCTVRCRDAHEARRRRQRRMAAPPRPEPPPVDQQLRAAGVPGLFDALGGAS